MMFSVLSDKTIRRYVAQGQIGINPFNSSRVQPASVDFTLGNVFKKYQPVGSAGMRYCIDLRALDTRPFLTEVTLKDDQVMQLDPQQFCLASTVEYIRVPDNLVARVEGKSSLGRIGLTCHATAGFIDPGFEGNITLELFNMNCSPIILTPGLKICQVSFMTLTERTERPYGHPELGSHYQGQTTVTESRYEG